MLRLRIQSTNIHLDECRVQWCVVVMERERDVLLCGGVTP
jgi:hypothetical protein